MLKRLPTFDTNLSPDGERERETCSHETSSPAGGERENHPSNLSTHFFCTSNINSRPRYRPDSCHPRRRLKAVAVEAGLRQPRPTGPPPLPPPPGSCHSQEYLPGGISHLLAESFEVSAPSLLSTRGGKLSWAHNTTTPTFFLAIPISKYPKHFLFQFAFLIFYVHF